MNASSLATCCCTLLSVVLATSGTLTAQEPPTRKEHGESLRTLTVTGTGEAMAAPDRAVVRLGATAQAAEAAAAQLNVNDIIEKALSQIENAGIAKRSIRTSGLTLTPIYAPQKPDRATEPRVVAYRAGNVVEVTVEDIKLVGKAIDAGLGAGANRLEGVTFGLKDDLPQRNIALKKAVEEARAKAQTIARSLDISLGGVREVVEGGVHILPQERFAASRAMIAADGMQTPVEPGEVRVQASVTIHYDIGAAK
jgi:uncharacterized protein